MKTDLATAIGVTIVGVLIAYFTCNLFLGEPEDFSVKTIDSTVDASLAEPDVNVFNYKAINPTVEVYVGDCKEYNQYGECIDDSATAIEEGTIDTDNQNSSTTEEKNNTSDQGNP
ncbi:hypothetical protein IKF28_03575 [Candidatus Saccharibacteria bacterium]|nr:hypothetical protein [Candidatus Saccharibacteria bacterium]